MKRALLILVLIALVAPLAGCPGDAEHNAKHLYIWKRDLQLIHREWDTFWLEDQPSRLSPYRDF